MGSPDALLAARLAAGDDRALTEVYDRYAADVYAAAFSVLRDHSSAQDVVQDTFVALWSHPLRYVPQLGTLQTYLRVAARHRAVDLFRAETRRAGREQRHQQLLPEQRAASPSEEVTAAATATLIRDAVHQLPAEQREVVELAYFRGLSYRAVAVAAGIPEGTAKSRLRLAMSKLTLLLDRQLLESS